MSQLRFCRTSARLLSRDKVVDAATAAYKQTWLLRHFSPFIDAPSQTQFQNGEIFPYITFSELFN